MTEDGGVVSAAVNEHLAEENERLKMELALARDLILGIRQEIRIGQDQILTEVRQLRIRVDNLNNQVAMQDVALRSSRWDKDYVRVEEENYENAYKAPRF